MELEELLLHPQTRQALQFFITRPSHALLISGPAGSGKAVISRALAKELLGLSSLNELEFYPYFSQLSVAAGKQDIPIDSVRGVIRLMSLKVPGSQAIRRVVFIEDAQNLSQPAQNAILKILEEPAGDTVFILTTNSVQAVLPTIASRSQKIVVQPVSQSASRIYFKDHSQSSVDSAWLLSGGRAALLQALLDKKSEHPLRQAVDEAKKFLVQNRYDRLLGVLQLSQDRRRMEAFLDALDRTLSALHRRAVDSDRIGQSAKLLNGRKAVKQTINALADNTNPKLAAIDLVLSLDI